MDTKDRQDIALMRYAILSPILNDESAPYHKKHLFQDAANKTYHLPNGKAMKVSWYTIDRWYRFYQQHGVEGLLPQTPKIRANPANWTRTSKPRLSC